MTNQAKCHRNNVCRIALLLSLMFSTGCGNPERATVSGTLLRKDGTPLAGARVIARSNETGKAGYGQTDGHGRFELGVAEESDGIPPGDYYVVIVEDRGDEHNRRPPTIAAKYRNPSTSGLALTVKAGENAELNATLEPPE